MKKKSKSYIINSDVEIKGHDLYGKRLPKRQVTEQMLQIK